MDRREKNMKKKGTKNGTKIGVNGKISWDKET